MGRCLASNTPGIESNPGKENAGIKTPSPLLTNDWFSIARVERSSRMGGKFDPEHFGIEHNVVAYTSAPVLRANLILGGARCSIEFRRHCVAGRGGACQRSCRGARAFNEHPRRRLGLRSLSMLVATELLSSSLRRAPCPLRPWTRSVRLQTGLLGYRRWWW